MLEELNIWEKRIGSGTIEQAIFQTEAYSGTGEKTGRSAPYRRENICRRFCGAYRDGETFYSSEICSVIRKKKHGFRRTISGLLEASYRTRPFRRGMKPFGSKKCISGSGKCRDFEGERKQAWDSYLAYLENESDFLAERGYLVERTYKMQQNVAFRKCREAFEKELEQAGFQLTKSGGGIFAGKLKQEIKRIKCQMYCRKTRRKISLLIWKRKRRSSVWMTGFMQESGIWMRRCHGSAQLPNGKRSQFPNCGINLACGRKQGKLILDHTDRIRVTRKDGRKVRGYEEDEFETVGSFVEVAEKIASKAAKALYLT